MRCRINRELSIKRKKLLDISYLSIEFPSSLNQKITEYLDALESEVISPEEFKDILMHKDSDEANILHHVVSLCSEKTFIEFFNTIMHLLYLEDIIFDKDSVGMNALHHAIESENINKIRMLVEYLTYKIQNQEIPKERLLEKNNFGLNILHFAVDTEDLEILKLIFSFLYHTNFSQDEIISLLIEQDNTKTTPLHSAVESCDMEILKVILDVLTLDKVKTKDAFLMLNDDNENVFHLASLLEEKHIFLELLRVFLLSEPSPQDIENGLFREGVFSASPVDYTSNWNDESIARITFQLHLLVEGLESESAGNSSPESTYSEYI